MSVRNLLAAIVALSQVESGNNPGHVESILATEGEDVRLECNRIVKEPVDWEYSVDLTHMTTFICTNGLVMDDKKTRFELDFTTCSLTIKNVTTDDSGLYQCVEEAGFGEKHVVRLTVEIKDTSESTLSMSITEIKGTSESTLSMSITGHSLGIHVVLIIFVALAVAAPLVVADVYFTRSGRACCFQEHDAEIGSAAERIPLKDRPERTAVAGVAYLHNSLFFILDGGRAMNSLRMQWHESWISRVGLRGQKLKLGRDIELPRVVPSNDVTANDLVASRQEKILYIVDDFYTILKCVLPPNAALAFTEHREYSERGMSCKIEPMLDRCNACAISLTHDGFLLVTTRTHSLMEFAPDGEMKNRITVPDYMKVSHAVKTRRNTYLACHTGHTEVYTCTEDTLNDGLTEFDLTSGYVVRSFGGPRGGGMGRVNRPSHLAIDDAGRVCVADSGNRRVLLMNDRLEVECVLVETEAEPRRLCYIDETSELVVGMDDGAIGVYRIHGRTAELIDMFPETRHRATSM